DLDVDVDDGFAVEPQVELDRPVRRGVRGPHLDFHDLVVEVGLGEASGHERPGAARHRSGTLARWMIRTRHGITSPHGADDTDASWNHVPSRCGYQGRVRGSRSGTSG